MNDGFPSLRFCHFGALKAGGAQCVSVMNDPQPRLVYLNLDIFTQEKSRRLDFNKAFNLVTLYISNIYAIKVFSLLRKDRTQNRD